MIHVLRIYRLMPVVACLSLLAGCWDTPLDGTTFANRSELIDFHAFIPVPHGQPLPVEPVELFAQGTTTWTIASIQLQPSMFYQTLGQYDWYQVSVSDVRLVASQWKKKNGRYESRIFSLFRVPHMVPMNWTLPFFNEGSDVTCFRDKIELGHSIRQAWDACDAQASIRVYANQ
jgi:hypothetical protein